MALLLTEATELLLIDLENLLGILKRQAYAWKDTVMMGRSHGIHAEPITFGLKFALWYAEMARHRERLQHARESIRVGKISGAVGTFATIDPAVEKSACDRLGLVPAPSATRSFSATAMPSSSRPWP